jgi:chemotaxis protein methyltransferase CheR
MAWEPTGAGTGEESRPDPDFLLFIRKVKEHTSIDLSLYKEAQMKRRLTTLRLKRGYATFAAYFEAMQKQPELLAEFLDRMTINVSEFWRNRNRWEVLDQVFIPEMLRTNRRLKCWSAACSTGEEPYTLAMILDRHNALRDATLHATDIDEGALAKAKSGRYLERSLKEVPKDYVRKYFRQDGMEWLISDDLKRHVKFKKQNLLTDPFESGYDLIVCRNVLIYFTEEAKDLLYRKFSDALRPGGVLFVGSTEQIFTPARYGFQPAETFFYRKAE